MWFSKVITVSGDVVTFAEPSIFARRTASYNFEQTLTSPIVWPGCTEQEALWRAKHWICIAHTFTTRRLHVKFNIHNLPESKLMSCQHPYNLK